MGTKIENLSKKASDIVDENKEVTKLSKINSLDRSIIKSLLDSPLLDEEDTSAVQNVDNALVSDSDRIDERTSENEGSRKDALDDVDGMIQALSGNLQKLDEIRSSSDLISDFSSRENTQSRIEELEALREMLGGESDHEYTSHLEDGTATLLSNSTESFREKLRENNIESVKHDYALGVAASNVNFSEEYKAILKKRYSQAEKGAQEVFDIATHKSMLYIADGNFSTREEGSHYYPINKDGKRRGIYYNAIADELDFKGRGKGTTFFHEIGHMIDHAFGQGGFISSSDSLLKALYDDLSMIRGKMDLDKDWANRFVDLIDSDNTAHSISDILEGLTNGAFCGRFGHLKSGNSDYWTQDKYRVCNESFAHFFEASMGGGTKLRRLKICFPTAFAEFETILNGIAENNSLGLRARERERN